MPCLSVKHKRREGKPGVEVRGMLQITAHFHSFFPSPLSSMNQPHSHTPKINGFWGRAEHMPHLIPNTVKGLGWLFKLLGFTKKILLLIDVRALDGNQICKQGSLQRQWGKGGRNHFLAPQISLLLWPSLCSLPAHHHHSVSPAFPVSFPQTSSFIFLLYGCWNISECVMSRGIKCLAAAIGRADPTIWQHEVSSRNHSWSVIKINCFALIV